MDTLTIGERIRHRRLLHGWSVRHAASRAGISHATWSRIERGRQAADNRFVLADIATALECSPTDLAGMLLPSGDRAAFNAQSRVYAVRQALVELDLNEEPGGPGRPAAELGRTVELVDDLRQKCDYAAAAKLIPGLLSDLRVAVAAGDRDAIRLLCHATFMTSTVVRNLGHPAEAWLAAERCWDAAQAAGDPVLIGYGADARATAAMACDAFDRALSLASRAIDVLTPHAARPGATELIGSLQLVAAYASRGAKRVDDSRAWAAQAAELAARTGETKVMSLYFGPTNVNIWRIGMEADGGDPGEAVRLAKHTNPAVIAANFRQVFFYSDVGRSLAALKGKDREATRMLLTAERIAPQHFHTSTIAQETVRALLERSRRQAAGSELRGLCERMSVPR